MARRLLLPEAPLAPFVRHIMVGGFESSRVHLPACADVQLLIYLRGGAALIDPAGRETALPPSFLVGAVNHPRLYSVEPDSRFIAATFRPGGLHACLGFPASDVTGRITAIETPAINAIRAQSEDRAAALLQTMLQDGPSTGTPPMPQLDPASLNRPIAEIARDLGISARQFERRCLSSLGMPLRDYRRLARYSSAMTALMMQGASPQALASLAHEAQYTDQAHFTRDFSAMVGQPPGRFLRQRGDAQYQLWQFTREELESYLT